VKVPDEFPLWSSRPGFVRAAAAAEGKNCDASLSAWSIDGNVIDDLFNAEDSRITVTLDGVSDLERTSGARPVFFS
jgi:hypothetical protein